MMLSNSSVVSFFDRAVANDAGIVDENIKATETSSPICFIIASTCCGLVTSQSIVQRLLQAGSRPVRASLLLWPKEKIGDVVNDAICAGR